MHRSQRRHTHVTPELRCGWHNCVTTKTTGTLRSLSPVSLRLRKTCTHSSRFNRRQTPVYLPAWLSTAPINNAHVMCDILTVFRVHRPKTTIARTNFGYRSMMTVTWPQRAVWLAAASPEFHNWVTHLPVPPALFRVTSALKLFERYSSFMWESNGVYKLIKPMSCFREKRTGIIELCRRAASCAEIYDPGSRHNDTGGVLFSPLAMLWVLRVYGDSRAGIAWVHDACVRSRVPITLPG